MSKLNGIKGIENGKEVNKKLSKSEQKQKQLAFQAEQEKQELAGLPGIGEIPGEEKLEARAINDRRNKGEEIDPDKKAQGLAARRIRDAKRRQAKRDALLAGSTGDVGIQDVGVAILGPIVRTEEPQPEVEVESNIWFEPAAPHDWDPEALAAGDMQMADDAGVAEAEAEVESDSEPQVAPVVDINAKSPKKGNDRRKYIGTIASHVAATKFGLSLFNGGRRVIMEESSSQIAKVKKALSQIETFMKIYVHARTESMKANGKLPLSKTFVVADFEDQVALVLEALKDVKMLPEASVYFSSNSYCKKKHIKSMLDLFENAPLYREGSGINLIGFYEALFQAMQAYYKASGKTKIYFFTGKRAKRDWSVPQNNEVALDLLASLDKVRKSAAKAGVSLSPLSLSQWQQIRRNKGISFPKSYYHPKGGKVIDGELETTIDNPKYLQLVARFQKLMLRVWNARLTEEGKATIKELPTEFGFGLFAEAFAEEIQGKWLNAEQLALEWEMVITNISVEMAATAREMFTPFMTGYLQDRQTLLKDTTEYHQTLELTMPKGTSISVKAWLHDQMVAATPDSWTIFVDGNAFKKEEPKAKKPATPMGMIEAAQEAIAEGATTLKALKESISDKLESPVELVKPVLSSLKPVNDNAELSQADSDVESLHETYSEG